MSVFSVKSMTPIQFYIKHVEQVYRCRRCGQEFDTVEEMKQHCIIQANNSEVKQVSLEN
jgi:predicted nucleic acid-binding Zn ribbon protein